MKSRPFCDFPRNEQGLVDNFIGTAFDIVKRVNENLAEIQRLDAVLGEIEELATTVSNQAVEAAMVPARIEINGLIAETEQISQNASGFATASANSATAAQTAAQQAIDSNASLLVEIGNIQAEVDSFGPAIQAINDNKLPVLTSLASLRAYAGNAKGAFVLGAVDGTPDEQGGVFKKITGTKDDNGVYIHGTFAWIRSFSGYVHASWYGVKGGDWTVTPLTVDYTTQCQAAIDCGCVEFGGVVFPAGHILITASLVFPNKGYDVRGSSGTRTEFICNINGVRMLDFSAANGPAKTVIGIGCSTLVGGYKALIGFYTNNTNGLYLQNCWARGLEHGLRFHGSFININNCAFEYCYWGIRCYTSCQESCWSSNTFYKNEQADVWLMGNNATFTSYGSNHIGTRVEGWRIDGCNNATVLGITFENDGATGVTPILVRVTGISSGNFIHGMQVSNYGMYAISVEGANVTRNRFTGLNLRNVQAVGNRAIRCISSAGNYFEGNAEGWEAALDLQSTTDSLKMSLSSNGIGCMLNAANYVTLDLTLRNNTSDFYSTNMTILNLLNVDGDTTGLAAVPYIITRHGMNVVAEVLSIPTALSWKKGDRAVNTRNATVGQPKGWTRLTTGSAHVLGTDWATEGNL